PASESVIHSDEVGRATPRIHPGETLAGLPGRRRERPRRLITCGHSWSGVATAHVESHTNVPAGLPPAPAPATRGAGALHLPGAAERRGPRTWRAAGCSVTDRPLAVAR